MEKVQLIELMDSAIELDRQLSEWMSEEEERLHEHSVQLDEKLPARTQVKMNEYEQLYAETATKAKALTDQDLAKIEAEKAKQLQAMEKAYREKRSAIVEKVMSLIRGDRLD